MDIIQQLYESEINCSVSSFWDSGFAWKLGDESNGFVAEGNCDSFSAVEEALASAARRHYPESDFAMGRVPE